jgi:hypothetical protein
MAPVLPQCAAARLLRASHQLRSGLLVAALLAALYPAAARAETPGRQPPAEAPVVGGGSSPAPTVPAVESEKPREGWVSLPIATYAPETQLGLGAFGTYFFRVSEDRRNERPSSISAVALYTWRKQIITELIPELWWDEDNGHLWSRLDYRNYPNKLWAVGSDAPSSSEESYTENRFRWQGRVGRAIRGPLRLYGHFELMHMTLDDVEPGGLIDRAMVPGQDGGFTMALGAGLTWDTRDHALMPQRGAFYDIVLMSSQPSLGSAYEFTTLVFDLRRYVPIVGEHSFAGNVVLTVQDGEAPFYLLPQLGGPELLRGYFEGRYRDQTLAVVQVEYRFPLFWRLGGVLHTGIGSVADTFRNLMVASPKWSAGTGLRAMLNRDERLNLRADVGVGRGTWGFYVGVGEAF